MSSSKFGRSPPRRMTPAYCKKVIPPDRIFPWPPPMLTATIWWTGQTDDSRDLNVHRVADLVQDPADPNAFALVFPFNGFRFEVDFFGPVLIAYFSCVLRVMEGAVGHALATAIDRPVLSPVPYDTREQRADIFAGSGAAGFRVLL